MGGKRTKNNTKPSSSGRSAEMLGSTVPTLFGFTTLDSSKMPVVPSFVQIETHGGGEDIDPNLDDTFQIVLKKMLKKDPTTKTKALQEFTELIGKSELDVVKAVLPFWPRLYGNLSTDVEHRVRETAQQAQAAVVAKAGKNIAPYLKQLAPAWISAQYDTYAPAASLASQSFGSAFPASKLREVFVFCEAEILDYYTRNLTVHTAITLSNPKSNTPEECENKYQRVLIASLRGYALYLSKVPEEQLHKSADKNGALLDSGKFWSYHKHKTPAIRSAWFEVVSALLQHAPFLVEKHRAQIVCSAFQFMDETDPTVVTHVWSSIVLVQTQLPDWSGHLNLDKAVFPKLWKVLKSGASGNAACVFPHMLPLVSKFSREVLGERTDKFYTLFFESINDGLKAVHSSRTDISAISQAYYEVFQYVVIQTVKDGQLTAEQINEFCERMLEDHLIKVVQWCITTESSSGRYIFGNIATLLDYWCQYSASIKIYEQLLAKFWTRLFEVVEQSIAVASDVQQITTSHVELIQNLKRTSHKRVKFNSGSAERHDEPDASSHHALRFEDQLHTLVYKICRLYVERITVTRDQAYVLQLENLVRQFQCVELFQFLAGPGEPIGALFDTFAGTWLGDARLQSEYIVEVVLILYKYLGEQERVALLNRWIKLANKTVRSWLILRALSHPLCQDANITQFLTLPEVSENLIECARGVTRGDTKENLILLHKCFLISDSGDVLIDPETCRRIVETLASPLGAEGAVELKDTCSSFLAQIMPVVCGDGRQRDLQRAMFALLFKFSAENSVSDYLSEDTLWEVTTAWQDALSSEDLTLDQGLIEDCTRIVDKELTTFSRGGDERFGVEGFEKLAEICAKLAMCSTESLKRDEVARCAQIDVVFRALMNVGCLEQLAARNVLEKLAVYIDLMSGAIITKSAEYSTNLSAEAFTKNARLAMVRELFCLMVVYKLSCNPKKRPTAGDDDDSRMDHDGYDDDEGYGEDDENYLHCWSELMYERVLSVLYTIAIGDTMLYSTNDLDDTVETLILALQEKMSSMMKLLPVSILDKLKDRLFRLANDHGLLWAKALTALLQTKQYSDPEAGAVLLYEDASTVVNSDELISYINILQILSRKMAPKCLPIRPNLFENYFDILVKLAATRSLIGNHFSSSFNEIGDKKIIGNTLIVLHEIISKQNASKCLLYNCDLSQVETGRLYLDTELANVLADVMRHFPTELDLAKWDFVRIALSSWTLTVSKNHQNFRTNNISIFVASIYRLFSAVTKFFTDEKIKSSTEMLTSVIEEWDNVFAKDVNLVLLKAYINIVKDIDRSQKSDEYFLDAIAPHIDSIDMNYVLKANKVDSKTSLDDLITFALTNVNHWNAAVRVSSAVIIHKLSAGLIQRDLEQLLRRHEQAEQQPKSSEEVDDTWHLLHRFKVKLDEFQTPFGDFVGDFNYKITDSDSTDGTASKQLGRDRTLAYLLLWDCILGICAKSPSELRSIYASWITRNHYEQILLPALFKLMPPEILKNPDSGAIYGHTLFASLELSQIKSPTLKPERYACHLYTQSLRFLPAVVRRWWNGLNHRHAAIVGKVTSNCVSSLLCQDEFQSLVDKKDRQDNMQIKVHAAARQVTAVYAIDEAKIELHITLPNNFPLGAVTVEDGKQIGGRLQSRQVVMQLSIFLTHQNGSIWDGLSLWKRNLDRKFEGVEECYVCYSVIHQDTCQLPKLSCKTCKKKFHGPCLYRWFSTSNKSTCPICRNIF